jgi:hypothetical protein
MELNTCPLDFAMQSNRSRCGTVGVVTGYRLYDPRFQFRQRQDIIFPFSKIFKPALRPTLPPIQWVPGGEEAE